MSKSVVANAQRAISDVFKLATTITSGLNNNIEPALNGLAGYARGWEAQGNLHEEIKLQRLHKRRQKHLHSNLKEETRQ